MTVALIDALTDLAGVTITVRHELNPGAQGLMDSLGCRVVVDPRAERCETMRDHRGSAERTECRECAALDRTRMVVTA